MTERIRLGHKDGEHGLWVSPPGVDIATANRFLLSSAADMLKIHAQGEYRSISTLDDSVYWKHEFELPFPDLGYIPLAIVGVKQGNGEVNFPPNLWPFTQYLGVGLGTYMSVIGIATDRIKVYGWNSDKDITFYYTVFRHKLLDGV